MTQKEAKIEALRCSVAWLNSMQTDYEGMYSQKDLDKIEAEKYKIVESLKIRAVKVGGDFNEYTGF